MSKLFFDSQSYFDSIIRDIDNSKKSILIEMFIVEEGKILNSLMDSLKRASQRQVKIYFVIDGYGSGISKKFVNNHNYVNFRFFKPLWNQIFYFKKRNHRKMFLIDDKISYVGSSNIHDNTLYWRESGVRVNSDNSLLKRSFWQSWNRSKGASIWDKLESKTQIAFTSFNKLLAQKIILTDSLTNRYKSKAFQWKKIHKSKNRIWIQTPYFNPPMVIFKELLRASERGVDIKIIVPSKEKTDMMISKTIERFYLEKLIQKGVEVYEYLPHMLHSKITLFDHDCILGSSNWNHRSKYRDLELDLIVNEKLLVSEVETKYTKDLKESLQLTMDNFPKLNFIQKLYFNLVMLIKDFS